MKPLKIISCLFFGLALALAGCQSDSPTEPGGGSPTPATPKPPEPVTTFSITVTANPSQIAAGGNTPSSITVDVRRNDTGQAPPDLTEVVLTTSLGAFNNAVGPQEVTLQLVNGRAQAVLYPGTDQGTATVRAVVGPSAGAANVQIGQGATFFVSAIVPGVGDPAGGEDVTITGGGFDGPVRVTFNNATAQVLSVQPDRIRVRTPSATAAGVTVPVGSSVPVSVGVTINVNETGTATDQLPNAFTYAHGGGIQEPTFFSISPASGTNDGGTTVRIRGTGFQAPIQVFFGVGTSASAFNGVEAQVQSVSSTEIVALTPAARGFGQNLVNQVVDILIKNVNTGFNTIASDAFKYGSDVLITAMGPGSGDFRGGTRVTIFGQGFDAPVAVSLGGVGQQVVSVSGTEVEFITSGVAVATCPANGLVTVTGVSVTNIESGASATANLGFNYVVPRPLIFGVNPNTGPVGTQVTISGQDFPLPSGGQNLVQVTFGGGSTTGSSATIVGNNTDRTIVVRVPTPPPSFTYTTQSCDDNGDGTLGTRTLPTAISVTVTDLSGTGCSTTLSNAFTLPSPNNNACVGDVGPPLTFQCSDGIDNDLDGKIDFGPAATNDPQCTSANDNSEST